MNDNVTSNLIGENFNRLLIYEEINQSKHLYNWVLEYGSSVWDPQGVVLQEELESVCTQNICYFR